MVRRLHIQFINKAGRHDAHSRIKAVGGGALGYWWKHMQEDVSIIGSDMASD